MMIRYRSPCRRAVISGVFGPQLEEHTQPTKEQAASLGSPPYHEDDAVTPRLYKKNNVRQTAMLNILCIVQSHLSFPQ
jgi:hypothetical protein